MSMGLMLHPMHFQYSPNILSVLFDRDRRFVDTYTVQHDCIFVRTFRTFQGLWKSSFKWSYFATLPLLKRRLWVCVHFLANEFAVTMVLVMKLVHEPVRNKRLKSQNNRNFNSCEALTLIW